MAFTDHEIDFRENSTQSTHSQQALEMSSHSKASRVGLVPINGRFFYVVDPDHNKETRLKLGGAIFGARI